MQWNARGLMKNRYELRNYLLKTRRPPEIICIQETLLRHKTKDPKLDGYAILRKDHKDNKPRGGLAILVKNGLNYTLKPTPEIPDAENQAIEVKTRAGSLEIINIYIPPSTDINKHSIGHIFSSRRTIIVGDYNAKNKIWGSTYNNRNGNTLEEIMTDSNHTVLNTGQATRVNSNQSSTVSVIDLSVVSHDLALNCTHRVENTTLGSDHLVTITRVNEEVVLEEEMHMQPWRLPKADWKKFKNNSKFTITEDLLTEDINETTENLTKAITSLANSSIPAKNQTKTKHKKHRPLPFWNTKCSNAIYARNKSRNKMLKTKDLKDYQDYKRLNAVATRTIQNEAREGWEGYCSELTNQSKLGAVWTMARRMNGMASNTTIPTLIYNNDTAETNSQKAQMFGQTYANTSSTTNYNREFIKHLNATQFETNTEDRGAPTGEVEAVNSGFNPRELKDAIASAKMNKSPGENGISYDLLKKLHKDALKVLIEYYNRVWSEGTLPRDWTHAIIIPIHKPNKDPTSPESYRPISLTCTICKIMEKMITSRLQWYTEKNHILTTNQTGFRKNKGTMDQILRLQDHILKKLKCKENVLAIFIDFERAYDMLHVPTLLRKLKEIGIKGNIYKWISNFLTHRTFQVKVGAAFSTIFKQENGTPQGSIISPLLFLIMINDIQLGLDNIGLTLFADDSAIYYAHKNIKTIEEKIQTGLNNINKWCNRNGFKISIAKTTGVLFTKTKKPQKIAITLNNQSIKIQSEAKFLGVIFDSRLTWRPHMEYIITKCKKRINLMRAVSGYKWGASKKALLAIYRALIRPILDYGDIAYSTASKSQLKKLATIQSEALRLACGAAKGTPIIALQNECGEMPLHLRCLQNSLKIGTKIISTKNHPTMEAMTDHWSNHYGKQKWHKESHTQYARANEFCSTLKQPLRAPETQRTPPWIDKPIRTDLSLKKKINKQTDSPELMKSAALELIDKYNGHTLIYTDGSKAENRVAAAYYIPSKNVSKSLKLVDNSSVYAAELSAIVESVRWISENENHFLNKFVILTDSLSAATSIKQNNSTSRPNLFTELRESTNKLKYSDITVAWIPSHVGLTGNEEADSLAKKGLEIERINSTAYLELAEIQSQIKDFVLQKWQTEYNQDTKGRFYKNIEPQVSTNIKYLDFPRKQEVQISRLRFGHVLSKAWLKKINKSGSDLCPVCQKSETLEHLLLNCKNHDISITLNQKCQDKKVEFNTRNILSIRNITLEAFAIIMKITNGKIL